MMHRRIKNATRVYATPHGPLTKGLAQGIAIRDGTITQLNGHIQHIPIPVMQTAWEPTPGELERLQAGDSIILTIWGDPRGPGRLPDHPIFDLHVEAPEPDDRGDKDPAADPGPPGKTVRVD